jgi:hypothetical protein
MTVFGFIHLLKGKPVVGLFGISHVDDGVRFDLRGNERRTG